MTDPAVWLVVRRWLFYIEGALTMFVALIAGVMLPDRLDNSRWFTQDELLVAKLRMAEDVSPLVQRRPPGPDS